MSEKIQSWFEQISPEDRIYYTRLIFAIIGAAIALAFNLSGPFGLIGFGVGLTLVIASYGIPIYLLGVNPEKVGGHGRGIIKGLGTGILFFLVIWLLGFNFIYALNPTP